MTLRFITAVALALSAAMAQAEPYIRSANHANTIYLGPIGDHDWGRPVASGDLDGDGYDDLVIAASDSFGGNISRVYVQRGGPNAHVRGTVDLSTGIYDLEIRGVEADDNLGASIATGDVNGDGFDDLLMCATQATANGRARAGIAYLLYGTPTFFASNTRNLADPGSWSVRFLGPVAGGDMGGANLFGGLDAQGAAIGDLNGDAFGDVVLGVHLMNGGANASGVVFIRFGSTFAEGTTFDLAQSTGYDVRILGRGREDDLGAMITTGDITGDGIEDLILGNEWYSRGLFTSEGAVHVFRGQTSWPAQFSLATANAPITLWGARVSDMLGGAVATGDFNGDGIEDLAAAAPDAELGTHNTQRGDGVVYGLLGGAHLQTGTHLINYATATADFMLVGDFQQNLGATLAAGDFNGDGIDDLAAGEWFGGGQTNGVVEVLFGRAFTGSPTFYASLDTDIRIIGAPQDRISFSLGAADVNGDGRSEVVFGTPFNNGTFPDIKGTVYVYTHVPGDADGDADVDGADYTFVLGAFGTCSGDAAFDSAADFDGDGCITFVDYQIWLLGYREATGNQAALPPARGSGDLDGDGLFRAADLAELQACQTGPGVEPAPAGTTWNAFGCTYLFDADADGDVDLYDFAKLTSAGQRVGTAVAPRGARN